MSSRSKEKMAAAFRKLFRSSQKIGGPEGATGGGPGCSSGAAGGSPARRLLGRGYHRDAVKPSDTADGLDSPDRSGRRPEQGAAGSSRQPRNQTHIMSNRRPERGAAVGGNAAGSSRKSVADLFKKKSSGSNGGAGGARDAGAGASGSAGATGGSGGGAEGAATAGACHHHHAPGAGCSGAAAAAVAAAAAASSVRARRLMKELREIQRIQAQHRGDPVFTVELVNDNLFEWHVHLHRVDADSELASDMRDMDVPYILLHLIFPDNFPFAPPFMRVISPRIEKGFVMEGGAICMELLTPRGWASAYTVEAVVMQFAASIVKGQGRIAKKHKGSKEFNRRSAEESFRSLVKTHEKYGWVTPPLADG